MSKRRARLPEYAVNGWIIRKCPNSFAEQYVYEATAVDATGFRTACVGFFALRTAKEYCQANAAPTERTE